MVIQACSGGGTTVLLWEIGVGGAANSCSRGYGGASGQWKEGLLVSNCPEVDCTKLVRRKCYMLSIEMGVPT